MINTFNDCFFEDYEILQKVKPVLDVNEYILFIKTKLTYSKNFKRNLYNETEIFLEVYNNFIVNIINDYIKCAINRDELKSIFNWTLNSSNPIKNKLYNKIFPQFIKLLINNINIVDEDRKMCETTINKPILRHSQKKFFCESDNNEDDEIITSIPHFKVQPNDEDSEHEDSEQEEHEDSEQEEQEDSEQEEHEDSEQEEHEDSEQEEHEDSEQEDSEQEDSEHDDIIIGSSKTVIYLSDGDE
jgi:hypothetical protein